MVSRHLYPVVPAHLRQQSHFSPRVWTRRRVWSGDLCICEAAPQRREKKPQVFVFLEWAAGVGEGLWVTMLDEKVWGEDHPDSSCPLRVLMRL